MCKDKDGYGLGRWGASETARPRGGGGGGADTDTFAQHKIIISRWPTFFIHNIYKTRVAHTASSTRTGHKETSWVTERPKSRWGRRFFAATMPHSRRERCTTRPIAKSFPKLSCNAHAHTQERRRRFQNCCRGGGRGGGGRPAAKTLARFVPPATVMELFVCSQPFHCCGDDDDDGGSRFEWRYYVRVTSVGPPLARFWLKCASWSRLVRAGTTHFRNLPKLSLL